MTPAGVKQVKMYGMKKAEFNKSRRLLDTDPWASRKVVVDYLGPGLRLYGEGEEEYNGTCRPAWKKTWQAIFEMEEELDYYGMRGEMAI